MLTLTGCIRIPLDDGGPFTVATFWSESERNELEQEFGRWLDAKYDRPKGDERRHQPGLIVWVPLAPGDDVTKLALSPRYFDSRPQPVDVVLGGPASNYVRLDRMGLLKPIGHSPGPHWRVARREKIGWAVDPKPVANGEDPPPIFDDPRHDPIALAWARGVLDAHDWAAGYARLVRAAGSARRFGRQAGSSLAAVARGEPARTPATMATLSAPMTFEPVADGTEWVEGVAIVHGDNHAFAELFLEFLAERGQAAAPLDEPGDPDADALLADLLGATLVDAQDELWDALKAMNRARTTTNAERWLTEPPPWPPASVERLRRQDSSGALLETLTRQIAPDADVRAWLVRSWLGPARPIDGALLSELSRAVEGKLAREPRFRAWLKAEWTAWARQRYRRVARLAEAGGEWR